VYGDFCASWTSIVLDCVMSSKPELFDVCKITRDVSYRVFLQYAASYLMRIYRIVQIGPYFTTAKHADV